MGRTIHVILCISHNDPAGMVRSTFRLREPTGHDGVSPDSGLRS